MNPELEQSEKKRIARSSVVAAIFLTSFKLFVGFSTNSLGILSEAAHSGLDLIAALITLVAITIADKPADEDHRYGHGKMENLSALVETLLLVITCGWIIWEAISRIISKSTHIDMSMWGFIVMAVSIVVDYSRSRALMRTAKKYNSVALEADALHFSTDIWSSLTVIAGLGFVAIGYSIFDSIAAFAVALIVLFISFQLGRRTLDALTDRISPELTKKIEAAIRSVGGVVDVKQVRVRPSGARYFVDTTIAIRRTSPFELVHQIMDRVERSVREVEPKADITVHSEPIKTSDETAVEKIQMILLKHDLRSASNLEIHESSGKYFVDFTLQCQEGTSFEEAHAISDQLEDEIHAEISSVEKVTIHIEEYSPPEESVHDVTKIEKQLCANIRSAILKNKHIRACSDLTLLQEGTEYRMSVHCTVSNSQSVGEVDNLLTQLEATLYKKFPQLHKVVIHAEPE